MIIFVRLEKVFFIIMFPFADIDRHPFYQKGLIIQVELSFILYEVYI